MANLARNELQAIIGRDKPGFQVIESGPPEATADDVVGGGGVDQAPDIADLRKLYLGNAALGTGEAAADSAPAEPSDDEVVIVAPQHAGDPWHAGPGPKSVLISGKRRQVIAEQG